MIIGHTYGVGFGDVVSDQSPSTAVSNVQKALNMIAALTGRDYGVGSPTGRVDQKTASALFAVVHDGVEGLSESSIPVVGGLTQNIINIVGSVPGLSLAVGKVRECLRDRKQNGIDCSFPLIWNAIEAYDPQWLTSNVIEPIRKAASTINGKLEPIVNKLQQKKQPGTTPPRLITTTLLPVSEMYPSGTVAVRDPVMGKYRLIAPPVK